LSHVLSIISIEKRTFIIASPICGAGNKTKTLIRLPSALFNNLLYEVKNQLLYLKFKSNRYSRALSQSLKDTRLVFGKKKYDYKSGSHLLHSGIDIKPFRSMLPYKSFSTISHCKNKKLFLISSHKNFNKLWALKGNNTKHTRLIDVFADVLFSQMSN
jgi:hypothetical protein